MHLCKLAKASRSGFYSWRTRPPRPKTEDEKKIVEIFYRLKEKAGYRRLKMHFERAESRAINIKKVRRIKRTFNLKTKVRKSSKFRTIFAAGEEHSVAPNLVRRNFQNLDNVLVLIDITEFRIRNGQKAWLFAAKEAASSKVVAHSISLSPSVHFVCKALEDYLKTLPREVLARLVIHSDQGVHFTSKEFRTLLKTYGVMQSMSRKGNCLDNAPIESFFGHLKDEVDYRKCKRVRDLKKELNKYITYYNYERPQWCLKQKTPAEAGVELSLFY